LSSNTDNLLVKASSNFPKTWPSDQLARPGWWWHWQCMVVNCQGRLPFPCWSLPWP